LLILFCFFSSRRRHTRFSRDWSSDVCSSDLEDEMGRSDPRLVKLLGSLAKRPRVSERLSPENGWKWLALGESLGMPADYFDRLRSEERRVGKQKPRRRKQSSLKNLKKNTMKH